MVHMCVQVAFDQLKFNYYCNQCTFSIPANFITMYQGKLRYYVYQPLQIALIKERIVYLLSVNHNNVKGPPSTVPLAMLYGII